MDDDAAREVGALDEKLLVAVVVVMRCSKFAISRFLKHANGFFFG